MEHDVLAPRRVVRTLVIVVLVALVVWALFLAREALLLIYIGGLLAVGLTPLVRLIERLRMRKIGIRRVPRTLAILIIYLVFLAVLLGLFLMVVPPVVYQITEFSRNLPTLIERLQNELIKYGVMERALTFGEAIAKAPEGGGSSTVSAILGTAQSVLGGLIGIVTMLILTFYLLVDSERMLEGFLQLVPRARRQSAADAARTSARKVAAWLGGNLILAAIMGTATAVGLFFMNVPYFYVVAVIAAVGELIPVLGPMIAGVVAVAVAMTVSMKLALAALAYFVVLHQLEANVLVPKVMEKQVGLSPVAVIIALMIGSEVHGLVGAILAVPTAAILMVIFEELMKREDATE
jgi:predicted PurR-regulated permease PerM